uniref:Cold shock domain-containing protein 4-like n=2 Tax=Nicotiana TaxID=4085 RepID=A0A1S4AV57_TOBAC|nr:PREDICTED: cold shock domain-containing protein 4-like [Nicotiana sylvestris]XP_016480481.1 PREDICTED: cold shock domain-containing protein 4-like [Nicotiana tabacum]
MRTSYQLVVEITLRIEGYRLRGREQMQQDKRSRFSGEFKGAPARDRAIQGSSSGHSGPQGSSGSYSSAMPESSYHPLAIPSCSGGYSGHQGQASGHQAIVPRGCYECGDPGHMKRTCPSLRG